MLNRKKKKNPHEFAIDSTLHHKQADRSSAELAVLEEFCHFTTVSCVYTWKTEQNT